MNDQTQPQRQLQRFLKLVSRNRSTGIGYTKVPNGLSLSLGSRVFRFDWQVAEQARSRGWVVFNGKTVRLSSLGISALEGLLQLGPSPVQQPEAVAMPRMNPNESPLMRLYLRGAKAGKAYLSAEEFQAGETLRRDFELGRLQPRITANLDREFGAGKRGSGADCNLSDLALDARRRFGNAIDVLGADLSGVAIDVCCFLKGLEQVERERVWPRRSAKLMLKTALSLLARHYGLAGSARKAGTLTAWGAPDFRPVL